MSRTTIPIRRIWSTVIAVSVGGCWRAARFNSVLRPFRRDDGGKQALWASTGAQCSPELGQTRNNRSDGIKRQRRLLSGHSRWSLSHFSILDLPRCLRVPSVYSGRRCRSSSQVSWLFVWNFFSVPVALHRDLRQKIAALETTIAELKDPPPDYVAIRHIDRMTLRTAAFYWCDLSPGHAMPSNVQQWYGALASAVTNGELKFEPKYHSLRPNETEREAQQRNPQLDTMVTRKALQAFAKKRGHDPTFLRDA
jgi:hypothetical protein